MDRGAWWAAVHGATRNSDSRTELSTGCFHGKPQVSASLVRGRHLVGKDGNCRLSLCLTVSAGSLV